MVSAFRFIDFFAIAERMSATSLEQRLSNFTRALREQGIIDAHFEEMKELESETPCLVMDAITTYIRDADSAMAEVTQYLGAPLIHYPRIKEISYQLKGSSSSIGGCRVASACCELRDASEANDKERSLNGFNRVRSEYLVLRENLTHILQMERAINAMNPRRRLM